MLPSPRIALRGAAILVAALAGACLDPPGPDITKPDEFVDEETLTAISWVGIYDGWGEVKEGDRTGIHRDVLLRVTFDADSIRREDCPACLTFTVDPWFSLGNVRVELATEVFLSYQVGDVRRTLSITRFSGGERTANVLLAALRHEEVVEGEVRTLLNADMEFRKR